MPKTFATAAAVVMGLVCPAAAEIKEGKLAAHTGVGRPDELGSPRPDVAADVVTMAIGMPSGLARIDHARIELSSATGAEAGGRATVTLRLSTDVATVPLARDVVTYIDVPHGARATSLSISMGQEASRGALVAATEASATYRQILGLRRDPALLEHAARMQREDRLALHVYPLVRATPATVRIELALPAARTLELARIPAARVEVLVDGEPVAHGVASAAGRSERTDVTASTTPMTTTIELPPAFALLGTSTADVPGVDIVRSLVAYPEHALVPTIRIGCGPGRVHYIADPVDKNTIRTMVRRAHDRLRHCYTREAQRDPRLAGTVGLHFSIAPDGRVEDIELDGTLESAAVRQCIAEDLAAWQFPASEDNRRTRVNYPLEFRLAR
jgi:hypothetical protein